MTESFVQRSAFESWPVAKPLTRVLAFLLDSLFVFILVFLLLSIFNYPIHSKNTPYFWLIAMWFWETFFVIFLGTTPGKKILGLSIFAPKTDGIPSPVQVSLRTIMFWLSFFLLGVGLLPILYRRDRRGWQDLIGEVLVVGKTRSLPHPLCVKAVPGLSLVLSLVLFSGIGAKIFSTGLEKSYVADKKIKSCHSIENFTTNIEESLTSLALSPAWRACWPSIEATYKDISDSQIFDLVRATKDYHDAFFLQKSAREEFYQNKLKPQETKICKFSSKNCNSLRFLNAKLFGTDISINEHWFKNYEFAFHFLSSEPSEYLNNLNGQSTEIPWLKNIYNEIRVSLDSSLTTKIPLDSANLEWQKGQICISQIKSSNEPVLCEQWSAAYNAFLSAKDGNFEAMENYLDTRAKDFLYSELSLVKSYFQAANEKEKQMILDTYPADRVFYEALKL